MAALVVGSVQRLYRWLASRGISARLGAHVVLRLFVVCSEFGLKFSKELAYLHATCCTFNLAQLSLLHFLQPEGRDRAGRVVTCFLF